MVEIPDQTVFVSRAQYDYFTALCSLGLLVDRITQQIYLGSDDLPRFPMVEPLSRDLDNWLETVVDLEKRQFHVPFQPDVLVSEGDLVYFPFLSVLYHAVKICLFQPFRLRSTAVIKILGAPVHQLCLESLMELIQALQNYSELNDGRDVGTCSGLFLTFPLHVGFRMFKDEYFGGLKNDYEPFMKRMYEGVYGSINVGTLNQGIQT